jgi:hypothetical protein
VRRLALFLERSIDEGTQWAVFESNGEALWSELRRRVEKVHREGALHRSMHFRERGVFWLCETVCVRIGPDVGLTFRNAQANAACPRGTSSPPPLGRARRSEGISVSPV